MEMPKHDFYCPAGHIVKETPVMRNEHDGSPVRLQVILEPLDGLNVKVVGRLIKKEQVRLLEKDLGQLYPHVPSLAERLCFPVKFIFLES